MNVHGAAVAEVVEAPHLIEQLIARVDAVGRCGQMIEQLQLLGRCVDLLAVHDQLVGVKVDDELIEHETLFRVLGDLRAAEHGVDARDELLHLKGLDEVIVRAHLETVDAVVDLSLGGEHDDGAL